MSKDWKSIVRWGTKAGGVYLPGHGYTLTNETGRVAALAHQDRGSNARWPNSLDLALGSGMASVVDGPTVAELDEFLEGLIR